MASMLTPEILESLLVAIALGAVVGIERETAHRPAGLRTHMLVSLGSCLFTIMSTSFGSQPAQVASGIVAGIGFIGAGTIWAERDKVKGITTAASLWATGAIGLASGLGDFLLAATVTFLVFLILASKFLLWRLGIEKRETSESSSKD
jgi:putative Mg2+ transporter-C (MgtC) family protein